jgi:exo-1,4-beta-D-glucosaminidase
VSRNVYWLSTKPDVLDWEKSEWYYTPIQESADMTALNGLARAEVKATAGFEAAGVERRGRVVLDNPSKALAFFVHLSVRKGQGGEEVLPVLWEDNDVTLLPGERRELTVRFAARDLGTATPVVAVEGWNVSPATAGQP